MASTPPVLAEQRDVTFGVNGCYDIRLLRMAGKALTIEVTLRIFFDFVPNEADATVAWNHADRQAFLNSWRQQIAGAWNRANHVTCKGHPISITFVCDVRGAAAGTQWQARVFRMKAASDFRTSAVSRNGFSGNYDAEFDSNDAQRKPIGNGTQTAMIHEFGHMVGNPDEYKSGSPNIQDAGSIMHSGSDVRDRHLKHLVDWATPRIETLLEERVPEATGVTTAFIREVALATSAASELALVHAWRDSLAPGGGTAFTIRRRETLEPVAIDQVLPADFADLEVVFGGTADDNAPTIWRPRSAEALQAVFVE